MKMHRIKTTRLPIHQACTILEYVESRSSARDERPTQKVAIAVLKAPLIVLNCTTANGRSTAWVDVSIQTVTHETEVQLTMSLASTAVPKLAKSVRRVVRRASMVAILPGEVVTICVWAASRAARAVTTLPASVVRSATMRVL